MVGGRFKELFKKYGKVALGVHFSVSAASITGLYVAIKNNVDVESMLEKIGMVGVSKGGESEDTNAAPQPKPDTTTTATTDDFIMEQPQIRRDQAAEVKQRNRTAELAVSSGGALALAILLNKALFPVRVPITIALTPPVARFLARRQIIRNSL